MKGVCSGKSLMGVDRGGRKGIGGWTEGRMNGGGGPGRGLDGWLYFFSQATNRIHRRRTGAGCANLKIGGELEGVHLRGVRMDGQADETGGLGGL